MAAPIEKCFMMLCNIFPPSETAVLPTLIIISNCVVTITRAGCLPSTPAGPAAKEYLARSEPTCVPYAPPAF